MRSRPAIKIYRVGATMGIDYSSADDKLRLQFSEGPVVKELSFGPNIRGRYTVDGQLVEITLFELSRLLVLKPEEDESTLILTERETRQLEKLTEYPPERSARFLAGRARYRQALSEQEQPIGDDLYAWMIHQVEHLRNGSLNEIQRERLAEYFERQANRQRQEFEALIRRMLADRWKLDHQAGDDSSPTGQLHDFRARACHALQVSPSLRKTGTARLESIWQEARLTLKYMPLSGKISAPDLPENCPYTIERLLDEVGSEEPTSSIDAQCGDD